ncbi:hypothetical protein AJ79_08605 [Helicocarpus griseus UAMH5409]|uniref:PARP-type domain-containing protein n=1 Tax=Helicocarpus griseus UAMH5409 TaxID=1447875 RepID=A0A2B7WRR6_9EURO|nr:hypothetical protein AJ79_08605 [Helicocarpus griseus UAMH5409]
MASSSGVEATAGPSPLSQWLQTLFPELDTTSLNQSASDANDIALKYERNSVRRCIDRAADAQSSDYIKPIFRIEKSSRKCKCALSTCKTTISPSELRFFWLRIFPGIKTFRKDYYHLRCFEKNANFSQAAVLRRVEVTACVPGGVERLFDEWRKRQLRAIARREQTADTDHQNCSDPKLDHLRYWAGSRSFSDSGQPDSISYDEYCLLHGILAPYESDGPGDTQELDLFDEFLGTLKQFNPPRAPTVEDLRNPHSLSGGFGKSFR